MATLNLTQSSFSITPISAFRKKEPTTPEKCDRETCAQKPSHIVHILLSDPDDLTFDHALWYFCESCTATFLVNAAHRIHQLAQLTVKPNED